MEDMKRVEQIVESLEPALKELARFIHENPEIGLAEYKACEAQKNLLEKYGFDVKTNICGIETAYEAVYKGEKPGPKIAMLAEYDALPEIGHACGHNLIAMVGVGAGIALKDFADEYGGEIYVFGTPAEESVGCKITMANAGIFDDMDVAMMSHPMDKNEDCMNTMALQANFFRFYGKPAHAAGAPHEGINALDAMFSFYGMVSALRQQTKDDARIHGYITNGGSAPNVIPDFTEAHLEVRANTVAYMEELLEKVKKCAEAAALGTGCRFECVPFGETFKDTKSNMTLAELNAQQMEKLGVKVVRTGGAILAGSSDMGDVSYCCPAIQNVFDISEGDAIGAHTAEFEEHAGRESAMDKSLTYIKGHVLTGIELMKNPEHLKAIKEEFSRL